METNDEKILSLAREVMKYSRSTLLVNMRFLDLALGQFRHIPADCKGIMTDGEHIIYDPRFVLKRYAKAQEIPARDYFHMIMHCVFKHHEFANLKGLIYFTDGYGAFPNQKPQYETAFVFVDEGINNYNVPPWAIKLIFRKDEI